MGSLAGIPISAPYGANLNCPSNIVINTTGTFNLLRTIGTNIGLLTVNNSGGATFAGTVDATTGVTLSNTSGTIAFNDTLTTPTLTTAAQPYNLQLNGTTGSITNAVTFANTGTLKLGVAGGTQTYISGLSASGPSAITLNGTLQSSSAPISLGASGRTVTLGGNVVINTYSDSGVGAALSIAGDVQATSAGSQALTLKSKSGSISVVGNVGSTASLSTLTLGDAVQTGAVTVDGTLNVQTLVAGASSGSNAFDVHLKNIADAAGTSTFSGAVTFYNTGTLGLGDHQSDVFNFQGGLTANASALTTIRAGQVNATNTNISVSGPVTVAHNSTVKAGSGQLSFGALTLSEGATLSLGDASQSGAIALSTVSGQSGSGAYSSLTLRTTAAISVSGAIGTRIGTLTITNSSGATFLGSVGTSSDLISQIVLTATTGTI